jgi:SulP family sulfate permease
MMVLSQLATMTGVKTSIDRTSNNLLYQSWQILSHVAESRWGAVFISLLVIGAAFLAAHFWPNAPAPLIGVLSAISIGALFGIHEKEIGHLPFEIPPFAGFYWTPSDVVGVLPAAFGLAFVSSVNILITSRVVEHFRGRHKHLKRADADAELGAYGIANVVGGMFAAPMSVGIPARSLASVRCGGTTRLSNIFHALFILAFLGLGSQYISHIPITALAGVTAYIGLRLLEWSTWRRLPRMRRVDALAFLSTAISVLIVNAVAAVAIGCCFYGVRYLYHRFFRPGARQGQEQLDKVATVS